MKTETDNQKWDKRFLSLAREVSLWSKDPSRQVGAIITIDNNIVSQGYNGFPRGIVDTEFRLTNKPIKLSLIVHAELNAILNAARNGSTVENGTMYIYGLPPCHECAKAIIQAGITRIVYLSPTQSLTWASSCGRAMNMFIETNIEIHKYEDLFNS